MANKKYIKIRDRVKQRQLKFEDKVLPDPNSGCWLWLVTRQTQGYGTIKWEGSLEMAHRVSYELYKKEIPYGIQVCHRCDIPSCVNPDHLFLGTNLENMQDRNKKGRQARGSKIFSCKLTPEQVLEIRNKYLPHKYTQANLAVEYNVSKSTISSILRGLTWNYL